MISLRKHIEANAEELARSAVTAYRTSLAAMAKAAGQAVPNPGADLLQKLGVLQDGLSTNSTAAEIENVQQAVDQELAQWAESAAQYSREKAQEIKEIMVAVAATMAAVGERDKRYSRQFSGLTSKLNSIARLEDLSSIRRSVVESAAELKTAVEQMATEGDQALSQLRAEVASYRSKLEQSEKREAADPLTGLANRRETETQIEDRIMWSRPFCLAILDLNGFKMINDIHGHVAGDDLLRQFAIELKAQLRATDLAGRWGGDEFVVVLDSNTEEAQLSIDRIRKWSFGEYRISDGKETVSVALKAAVGMAEWDGRESEIELLARADALMYSEKKLTSSPRNG
jgi:diguanylate cyclase (GGDEF)-like protein